MQFSSVEAVAKWRTTTKSRIVESMGGSCVICKYNACNAALALHHLDPSQKDFNISMALANLIGWKHIVEELRKCVLLCHNCHNEVHAGISSLPNNFAVYNEAYTEYKKIGKLKTYCPICNKEKPNALKYCSVKCYRVDSVKFDWASIDLLEELKTKTCTAIAKQLGCSDNAVAKHRNALLKKLKA